MSASEQPTGQAERPLWALSCRPVLAGNRLSEIRLGASRAATDGPNPPQVTADALERLRPTQMGPLVSEKQRDRVAPYVEIGLQERAPLALRRAHRVARRLQSGIT